MHVGRKVIDNNVTRSSVVLHRIWLCLGYYAELHTRGSINRFEHANYLSKYLAPDVFKVAYNFGDAKPISDAAPGGQQVNPRADAFGRHVLRVDVQGVPEFVEVLHMVNQGLEIFLDGDATDVDDEFALGRQGQRSSEFVAID
jgi:hypothetical protein